MSIVEAYRCDYCFELKTEQEVIGVTPIEDLFDRLASYPINYKNKTCRVHCCMECHKKYVTIEAQKFTNRRKIKFEVLKFPAQKKPHFFVLKFKHTNLRRHFLNVKENELEYKNKIKELSYAVRAKCVSNWRSKAYKEPT